MPIGYSFISAEGTRFSCHFCQGDNNEAVVDDCPYIEPKVGPPLYKAVGFDTAGSELTSASRVAGARVG